MKMGKKLFFVIASAFIVVSLLFTAAPDLAAAKAKTIKFAYTMPKGSAIAAGYEWFAKEFPKRSQGRYKVETYPSSTLVGIMAALDSVKEGVCEMAMTGTAIFPKDYPTSLVTSLPTLAFPLTSVEDFKVAFDAWWEIYNNVPQIRNEFKEVHLVWPYPLDPYNFVSKKKPVKKAADFKGMKVAGFGGLVDIVVTNGGANVHQAPPQTYMNMDKGVINGAFLTYPMVMHYKIWEIADYFYHHDFGSGTIVVIMNNDFYNSMPKEDQKLLAEVYSEAALVSAKGMLTDVVKGEQLARKNGMNIVEPTEAEKIAWTKDSTPAFKNWAANCKKLGVKDPEGILETYLKIMKKYGQDRMDRMELIK